ncbi:fatty acid desaturase 4, chloroplastic-like [Corylus avellana]|uniref:fatty acid desaturase 4, chloroplastic-like n=1 Tax=Corylus avellana TaxID=13451 RepID=UPI00286C935F|nr:fatty acid desaturase 4, chloroplastic-like [Corylus avellana]
MVQKVIEPRLNPSPMVVTLTAPNPPILNDPTLTSTWSHRAWVASGCTTVLISLAKAIAGAAESHTWLEPILAGLLGYILVDLASGFYHWRIDNYGSSSTPLFGTQIEAFQGHHKRPWRVTRIQFANILHVLARGVTLTVLPIDLACNDPTNHGFVAVCSGCIMFSLKFHAWAHTPKSQLPLPVVALQDAGLVVSGSKHAAHHLPPYDKNYCIVSGVWNEFLDKQRAFEALEKMLFFTLGVRPRSWSDHPSSSCMDQRDSDPLM